MRYSKNEVIDRTVRELLKNNWVVKSQGRHLRIFNEPLKLTITVPGTPSDHRAVQNWLHQTKRQIELRSAALAV